MGMTHNRALVSKTDINDIRRRCLCIGEHIPDNQDDNLEWLVINQGSVPAFNEETEAINTVIAKVDGKYDISYEKVSL